MSARLQAGQLKSILAKNFKRLRVREAMVQTLESNGQIASGNLRNEILRTSDYKRTSIRYKIDPKLDVIYNVSISYTIDFPNAPYARAVDTIEGKKVSGMRPSVSAIEQWISQKLSNGTWKGGNMYIIRRDGKNYSYPLSDFKYRKKLAYVIAKSIKERGYLKTRSPYLAQGKLLYELAFLESINEFETIWENDVFGIIENKLTLLF